jgi:hypothetical protein
MVSWSCFLSAESVNNIHAPGSIGWHPLSLISKKENEVKIKYPFRTASESAFEVFFAFTVSFFRDLKPNVIHLSPGFFGLPLKGHSGGC